MRQINAKGYSSHIASETCECGHVIKSHFLLTILLYVEKDVEAMGQHVDKQISLDG